MFSTGAAPRRQPRRICPESLSALALMAGFNEPVADRLEYGARHDRRYAVSDHPERVPNRRVKAVAVWEPLQTGCFPNGDYAGMLRMYGPYGLVGTSISSRPGPNCGTLAGPRQTGMPSDPVDAPCRDVCESTSNRLRVAGFPMSRKTPIGGSEGASVLGRPADTRDAPCIEAVLIRQRCSIVQIYDGGSNRGGRSLQNV